MHISFRKCLLTLLLLPLSLSGAHIIFDLGNVLIETHGLRSFWHLGPYKLSSYAARWRNPFACRQILYDFLHQVKALEDQDMVIKDEAGDTLPQLMCEWLKGTLPPEQILEYIYDALGKASSSFIPEHIMVQAVAELIFNPSTFIKTRSLINEGIAFVRDCKRHGHKVYILSNWDAHSFEILQEEYPDVFNLFDGIVISGKVGLLKPHPGIYYHLLTTHNLNPQDCIFIDDQLDNIVAAQNLGFKGIQYKKRQSFLGSKHNFDSLRRSIFVN